MKLCIHCNHENNMPRGLQCRTCKEGRRRYGLDRLQQVRLLESQNNKCVLCEKELVMHNGGSFKSGNIDHCHTTGKVRGILCHRCNSFLGYMENKVSLYKLKSYLCVGKSG